MRKLFLIMLLISMTFMANAEVLDKIVAKVGTEIILMSELQQQIKQLSSTGIDPAMLAPRAVLNQMVEQRLIVQKAKELDIQIDEQAIKDYAARYIKQIKSQYPSEADFQADLTKMKLTQSELQKHFEDQITENALSEQLIEKYISTKINVEESEMREFYETSKDTLAVKPVSWELRLIVREVTPSEESQLKARAVIDSIYQSLQTGADFAQLASEHSDCASSQQGGDLGLFKRGMMVKPFEDAAFELSVGETSGIVETQFGYHIIRLTEKRADEVRASHILKTVAATEADEEREMALMNDLRSRILAGEDFAVIAREYSMDPESKEDGGLLGEFTEQDIPQLFSAPILSTPVGEVTEVLKNEGMLYLFIRDKELPSRIYTYEEVKEQLQSYLFQGKQMQAYQQWIEEARRDAYIEISL
ncbi:MAG: peptidylprolyl isomerase [Candidatus Cloacimonadaceae bacterium]|jgi:peptidyl-prolyl cis-trans isomerase SurA|nr:peptidylprolyl isomerase [Candidatus Cloacimonadota bacterium]MDY0127852.1 peptidylprolyl isomerase [Candidatus Cloacimonadaceae bacterium]MCB5255308.1 peptidylprolyl isomerase [Candidatus Cloacimonadota bacterium]MCK9178357.1 peptidylprolyl isomerase [Candidatus Cloacimonadota bacterium]MCK9242132.1 peptidylprolyl isomerase [Candidatus Cloacimonadota bacterium]